MTKHEILADIKQALIELIKAKECWYSTSGNGTDYHSQHDHFFSRHGGSLYRQVQKKKSVKVVRLSQE